MKFENREKVTEFIQSIDQIDNVLEKLNEDRDISGIIINRGGQNVNLYIPGDDVQMIDLIESAIRAELSRRKTEALKELEAL